jgi:DNA-binding FadR family transcriptional regulator
MHRPVVEAILRGNPEASTIAMHKHTLEFGETLIKMEKAYREKKSAFSL